MRHLGRIVTGVVAGGLFAGALAARDINKLPPDNWSVPRATGVHTLADATPPRAFIGLPPCRIVDTRGTGGVPINTGGAFAANETRTWTFTGLCGLPATVQAVSLNFTVTNTQSNPFGYLGAGPGGSPVPASFSILNWSTGGVTVANATIVPLSSGMIAVETFNAGADVLVDVNGYFSNVLGTPGNSFAINDSANGPAINAVNTSTTCAGGCGVVGAVGSTSGAVGVDGYAYATGAVGINYGARGISNSATNGSAGTVGNAAATTGVIYGVLGTNASSTDGSAGVFGNATGTTSGATFGVVGVGSSPSNGAAGVLGYDQARTAVGALSLSRAGVRGESGLGNGVVGLSNGPGYPVAGYLVVAGSTTGLGILGFSNGTAYGVWADTGTIGCNGCTKLFVEPHPTDATKTIHYVSLEGNEAGTYFRGSGQTVDGNYVITVPEDFRLVTDPEGLTVQLTPVGAPAMMYVVYEDLNQIIVHSSADVKFHYLVQGIRPDYKNFKVIGEGGEYVPRSPDEVLPSAWPEKVKRALISNGTYNPDGTVNMKTAERLGWAKAWRQQQEGEMRAQPPPAEK